MKTLENVSKLSYVTFFFITTLKCNLLKTLDPCSFTPTKFNMLQTDYNPIALIRSSEIPTRQRTAAL